MESSKKKRSTRPSCPLALLHAASVSVDGRRVVLLRRHIAALDGAVHAHDGAGEQPLTRLVRMNTWRNWLTCTPR